MEKVSRLCVITILSVLSGLSSKLDLVDAGAVASTALANSLGRQGLLTTGLHTRRRATDDCDRQSFLAAQGEECETSARGLLETNTSTPSSRLDALQSFCKSCVEEYADYLEDVCDDPADANNLRGVCTEKPGGRLCGEFFILDPFGPLRSCRRSDQVVCSARCKEGLETFTNNTGCCVQVIESALNSTRELFNRLYISCDVEIPDLCDSNSGLGVFVGLPSALLIATTSVFLIACMLYL